MRGCLIMLALELALLMLILLAGIGTVPQVIEVVVTATPASWPTPTPDWSMCLPRGQGWFYCP